VELLVVGECDQAREEGLQLLRRLHGRGRQRWQPAAASPHRCRLCAADALLGAVEPA
jgi:hypothetical protein